MKLKPLMIIWLIVGLASLTTVAVLALLPISATVLIPVVLLIGLVVRFVSLRAD